MVPQIGEKNDSVGTNTNEEGDDTLGKYKSNSNNHFKDTLLT